MKNHMKHSHKRSITTQIGMVIIALVAGTVLLCWFLNTTFLGQYYSKMKIAQLESGYGEIDRAATNGRLNDDEFDVQFDRISANGNIEILVVTSDAFHIQRQCEPDPSVYGCVVWRSVGQWAQKCGEYRQLHDPSGDGQPYGIGISGIVGNA